MTTSPQRRKTTTRRACHVAGLQSAWALQGAAAMRLLAIVFVLSACASRQTAWTTLPPADLPDGGDAFVLVDGAALHVSGVEHVDGHLRGRVRHAWALPAVGVAAIADDTRDTSPEAIARQAGWPELRIASTRVEIPEQAIRSARGVVDVEPDEPASESEGVAVVVTTLASILEYALTPERCRCDRYGSIAKQYSCAF